MPGGTRDSCGSESRNHSVAPVVIAPTARVTISALSSSTATRNPLISPIIVAKNSAPSTAPGDGVFLAWPKAQDDCTRQRDDRRNRQVDAARHQHKCLTDSGNAEEGRQRNDGEKC